MKITTRIAAGLFLIAGLLIGVLVYQLTQIDRLRSINQELSLANIEAAQTSIRLIRGVEGVREFAEKGSLLRDSAYLARWAEWEHEVDGGLAELAALELSGEEAYHRARIDAAWRGYREVAANLSEATNGGEGADWSADIGEIQRALDDLRFEISALVSANRERVTQHAQNSVRAGEEARQVAWMASAAVLLLAGIISLALFASISGPLRKLTRGTQVLSRGRFDHRLEVSGPTELAALARDFNQMATRLGELEELKKDFISHVSHELKTPLAAIHETIEIFLERIPGPLTPSQEHLLELSRKSSGRLSAMIGDLLEVSRHESGAVVYRPAPHDLGEIAAAVLEETHPLAHERHIVLEGEPLGEPHPLICDEARIREVVTNLVGNALKFSPEGSRVALRIETLDRPFSSVISPDLRLIESEKGPFLLLSVEDEGPGVPDEQKEAIFEKFHQVARQGRIKGQGVGLGLAIARKIVHEHGGAIWVEDRNGGGALFRILLPAAPRRWKDAAAAAGRGHSRDGARAGAMSGAGVALAILTAITTSGCASLPWRGEDSAPPNQAMDSLPVEIELAAPPAPPPPPVPGPLLAEGQMLMESRAFEGAAASFAQVLEIAPLQSRERREALWGLALTRLLPESPLFDLERGTALLAILSEESPDTLPGIQAKWIRESLLELNGVRGELRERDLLVEELTRVLENYRRIDLERRPSP